MNARLQRGFPDGFQFDHNYRSVRVSTPTPLKHRAVAPIRLIRLIKLRNMAPPIMLAGRVVEFQARFSF